MLRTRTYLLVGGMLLVLLGAAAYYLGFRAPWEASGTLALAYYTVPQPGMDTDLVLRVGVGAVTLHNELGDSIPVTLRTREIRLDNMHDPIILFEGTVPTGVYTAISFDLKSPSLENPWESSEAPPRISLAHEEVRIPCTVLIEEGATSVALVGFERGTSLHTTGDHTYSLIPNIQIETRNNTQTVLAEDGMHVSFEGGAVHTSAMYGMDMDGTMQQNHRASR